jgi:hypothetical protein
MMDKVPGKLFFKTLLESRRNTVASRKNFFFHVLIEKLFLICYRVISPGY